MFTYKYVICTKPIKKKYWTRKLIYNNDKIYSYEDNLYNICQVNKLISSLDILDYSKLFDNKLPDFIN